MTEPRSKRFEKHVHKIQRRLAPKGAKITHNDRIMGFDSRTARQVETSIRYSVAEYDILLVTDSKNYSFPVDVVDMGAFKSLANDVRANRAVMISTSGYTAAAIEMARSAGIEIHSCPDSGDSEWHSDVSIPVVISVLKIDSLNLGLSSVPGHQFGIPSQPRQVPFELIEMIGLDGTPLGPILAELRNRWDEDASLRVPGEHAFNLAEHVVIREGANEFHSRVDAEIRVVQRHYLGPLEVNLKGSGGNQTFSIIPNETKTDLIDPERIERGEVPGWVEIPNKDELAVSVMFARGYVNTVPATDVPIFRERSH